MEVLAAARVARGVLHSVHTVVGGLDHVTALPHWEPHQNGTSRNPPHAAPKLFGWTDNSPCGYNDLKAAATMVEFPEGIRASAARKVSSTRCRMGAHRSG